MTPKSYQLRVQYLTGNADPKWTIKEVDGVKAREIWSAQTGKLILVRAAAARACGVRETDLPQEVEDYAIEAEAPSEHTALSETSPGHAIEISATAEIESGSTDKSEDSAQQPVEIGATAEIESGSTEKSEDSAQQPVEIGATAEIESGSTDKSEDVDQIDGVTPHTVSEQPTASIKVVHDTAHDELWSEIEFRDEDEFDFDPDVLSRELEFLGPQAVEAAVLANKLIEPATGLYTYPAVLKLLEHEFHRFDAMHSPLSLMLLEIIAGNQSLSRKALTSAAVRIELVKRHLDIAGHFEKDVLALVMPRTGPLEAAVVAQRAMELLNASPLASTLDNAATKVSIGIASLPADGKSLAELFTAAGAAKDKARQQEAAAICISKETR